ncbi:MAG: M28 family peptidase [Myxococcota bacterium]
MAIDDSDPVKHLKVLASDAMEGRGSPSEGLNKAAKYIEGVMKSHGVVGPNPDDPRSPYFQTFNFFQFAEPNFHAKRPGIVPEIATPQHKPRLYEYGFGLGAQPSMTHDDFKVLYERVRQHNPRAAKQLAPLLKSGPTLAPANVGKKLAETMLEAKRGEVQNVVGRIEGTGPNKDEVIVMMAHYDHLGTRFGTVYNGTSDNASGSSILLSAIPELVKAQKAGQLNRSIVFLWTAAEEKGLVGAQYFVNNPIPGAELDKISGVVNIDMFGWFGPERMSAYVKTDGKENFLGDMLVQANNKLSDPFKKIEYNVDGFRNRQDGWVFMRKGKDVSFLFEGTDARGNLMPHYHKSTDKLDKMEENNGFRKIRKGAQLAAEMIKLAANYKKPTP